MPEPRPTSCRAWSCLLFLVAGAVVLATFTDYGATWDEWVHRVDGDRILDYYASGFEDPASLHFLNLYYYGAAFDLLCAVGTRLSPLGTYDTRHFLNAAVALLGVLGCWFVARRLGTGRTAFIAAALLLLTPRWWGHGFNNPKDIPFAAGYVWSVYALLRVAPALPRVPLRLALGAGLAIGMTLAVRSGGLLLFGYLGLLMLASFPSLRPGWGHVRDLAASFAAILVPAWIVMLAFWPWAWSRPLTAPFESLLVMSNHMWAGTVLFAGEVLPASEIPRIYEVRWLSITLPEIVLLGLVLALVHARRESRAFFYVAFAALFPLVQIAILKPVIYDGMRHVLFVVPLLACLAARGLEFGYDAVSRRHRRAALACLGVLGVYLVYHGSLMVRLHPNEYVYFNRFVGGLPGAFGRYETDYWGNSYREAVGLLVAHIEAETPPGTRPPEYRVFSCSGASTTRPFFPRYLKRAGSAEEADFLLGTTRTSCYKDSGGTVVGVVERLGTPLNYVVDLRPEATGAGPESS